MSLQRDSKYLIQVNQGDSVTQPGSSTEASGMFQSLIFYRGTSVQIETANLGALREEVIASRYSARPACFEVASKEHSVIAALRKVFSFILKKMANSIFLLYSKANVASLKYLNRILPENRHQVPLKTQTNQNQSL